MHRSFDSAQSQQAKKRLVGDPGLRSAQDDTFRIISDSQIWTTESPTHPACGVDNRNPHVSFANVGHPAGNGFHRAPPSHLAVHIVSTTRNWALPLIIRA